MPDELILQVYFYQVFTLKQKEMIIDHRPVKLLNFRCVALFGFLFPALQKIVAVMFLFLFLVSCRLNEDNDKAKSSDEADFFFPVNEFFKQQIQSVGAADSIHYLRMENGAVADSTLISKEQFNKLAYLFIEHDIADSALKIYYNQSTFMDETTGSITFSYICTDKSLPIQSMDVLVDTVRQDVKRVFILSQLISGTDTTIEKLGWKNGESFFINSIKNPQAGNEETSSISVKWKSRK